MTNIIMASTRQTDLSTVSWVLGIILLVKGTNLVLSHIPFFS